MTAPTNSERDTSERLVRPESAQGALFGADEVLAWKREWQDMPEFVQEDHTSFRAINVHFRNAEDVAAFAALIGQSITPKQKALWFPAATPRRYADKRYVDEP